MFPSSTLEANLILDHVRQYLGAKSFAKDNAKGKLTFGQWCDAIDVASILIDEAQSNVIPRHACGTPACMGDQRVITRGVTL